MFPGVSSALISYHHSSSAAGSKESWRSCPVWAVRAPFASPWLRAAGRRRAWLMLLRKRVCPFQPGKPREVAIGGADRSAMFQRDCREDGVHDQRTGSLSIAHKLAQDVPVPFARVENPCGRLFEPRGNRRFGFGRGERTFEYVGICRDPQEGPQRKPSEAN